MFYERYYPAFLKVLQSLRREPLAPLTVEGDYRPFLRDPVLYINNAVPEQRYSY